MREVTTTETSPMSNIIDLPPDRPPSPPVQVQTPPDPFRPQNLEQVMKIAEWMANSTIVPKDYQGQPGSVFVAMQYGYKLGLDPFQAMTSISVINGRPAIWGDAALAMVLASPVCEYVREEEYEDRGVCIVKRRGQPEAIREFTIKDAEKAGLIGKSGPWQQYRKRMMKLRARGFLLRDVFPDVLKGLVTVEEAMDIPQAPVPMQERIPQTIGEATKSGRLKERLKEKLNGTAEAPKQDGAGHGVDEVIKQFKAATTQDELDLAIDLARGLKRDEDRTLAATAYREASARINKAPPKQNKGITEAARQADGMTAAIQTQQNDQPETGD